MNFPNITEAEATSETKATKAVGGRCWGLFELDRSVRNTLYYALPPPTNAGTPLETNELPVINDIITSYQVAKLSRKGYRVQLWFIF